MVCARCLVLVPGSPTLDTPLPGTVLVVSFDPASVPISPAATVIIVHDRPDLQVLMVRRTPRTVFGSGMWVFPGGRVDPSDADSFHDLVDGLDDETASVRLEVPEDGLSFWVAALRETYEESGILLAHRIGDPEPIRLDDPSEARRFAGHRGSLNGGTASLLDIVRLEGLRLVVDDIHYVSRWITPEGSPRRFDARFFVTHPPAHQEPSHDGGELIDWEWIRPAEALERSSAGTFSMMSPTTRMMQSLTLFGSAEHVMAVAREQRTWERARVVFTKDGYDIVMPGEPGYEEGTEDFERGWVRLRP